MKRNVNKAQSIIEYSIIIAVAVAVLLGMAVYIRRAIQSKYRQSADTFGQGEQYAGNATIETPLDGLGGFSQPGTDSCPNIIAQVAMLERDIADLENAIAVLEQRAVDLDAEADRLAGAGMLEQAERIREMARQFREQIQIKREEITLRRDRINMLRNNNPDCF